MQSLDYAVLIAYFAVMIGIGIWSMLTVKKQEDFFLGSRAFGRLFQVFAAFGAGTGSHDPVAIGRTTFTSGLSGIWSVLLWLFVTPFYWFMGVWYRRMRHITLGDWFVERYHSKGLGVAFMLFAVAFYMVYLALGFTAIGKVGAPLVEVDQVSLGGITLPIEHALICICALVVLVYGVLGGLRAAYWTDFIQGVFIILLSVLLIPMGLDALVHEEVAVNQLDPANVSTMDGFRIMHERVPAEYFNILESPRGGEFPWYYIVAITLLNLVAIVVHPHMAVTGGGTAKTENAARVGLVVGNFLKRFCTIGWSITILIVLAYMAGNREIAEDPDRVWGVAAREILGQYNMGLVGLMLACLMAALMSSASAYMLIVSALVVRNFYAAYIDPEASERTCVLLGRLVSGLVIVGGVYVSFMYMNVFDQLKVAWEMPILFASIFWVGMFWRRATKWAAWGTVLFSLATFFVVPYALPKYIPGLAENPKYAVTNDIVTTTVTRPVAHADVGRREAAIELWDEKAIVWTNQQAAAQVIAARPDPLEIGQEIADEFTPDGRREATRVHVARREAEIALWNQLFAEWSGKQTESIELDDETRSAAAEALGARPEPLALGEELDDEFVTGGKAIFWTGGVEPIGEKKLKEIPLNGDDRVADNVRKTRQQYDCALRGKGRFRVDFLLYDLMGIDLTQHSNALIETLRLPTRVVLPFLVMILLSLITPRVKKEELDRFYVKMKTPVQPNPQADRMELALSYENPTRFDDKRLLNCCDLEFQRPKFMDLVAFALCFVVCFALIALTVWLANLGAV